MPDSKDRVTIRLGSLARALYDAAAKSGRTIGGEIRYRLARSLRVPEPDMRPGNPDAAAQAKAAADARWAKKTTQHPD
jgi:hypothetical protein